MLGPFATFSDKKELTSIGGEEKKVHFSASRPKTADVGGSSNPSPQTPIQSSSNDEFANTRGLDAIDLNNDRIEDLPQESVHYWKWEEDEILISAWLNVSTDPVVGTDQKSDTF
ncbi:hypothetical protein PIB30_033748 [Stylosanthes scabra]|uniref:Uncharacterized protein n=1 Tax=Stylosanthes scabra TaxID=79078 RepID=A0ABU6RCX4_9FABA|nr:hypothetical protein [Stylosanthes scabra]